jgi:site-specific recombinase XerD
VKGNSLNFRKGDLIAIGLVVLLALGSALLLPRLTADSSRFAQVIAGDGVRGPSEPLLITYSSRELYPVYVDRVVKKELGAAAGFTGRKSPHVLRHSVATGLLDGGAQLNSIKEMLGHSSLAATQVYTHNSISKLKAVYKNAHPRAKSKNFH